MSDRWGGIEGIFTFYQIQVKHKNVNHPKLVFKNVKKTNLEIKFSPDIREYQCLRMVPRDLEGQVCLVYRVLLDLLSLHPDWK